MTTGTQLYRPLGLGTPLGDNVLLVSSASVTEQLGSLFHVDLVVLTEGKPVKFEDIIGQNVTLRMKLDDEVERYWNGEVIQFQAAGVQGDLLKYNMTIVPWIWYLGRTADFRIYQNKTVPDIIKSIFSDAGYSNYDFALTGSYSPWEYCVQYRETDLNFIMRLMEQEGIYFFFTHEDGKHTIHLVDGLGGHKPYPGYETVTWREDLGGGSDDIEHIIGWSVENHLQPGAYETMDYDFKRPKLKLKSRTEKPLGHAGDDWDVFDYPGEWENLGDGDQYTRVRLEELHAQYEVAHAVTNARGIAAGFLFTLAEFPDDAQNKEYLITSCNVSVSTTDYLSGGGSGGSQFSCSFTAIDAQTQFRSPRVTPKPVIQGPQTAVVVGDPGEEITVDEFGRIKVQFHWDRYGKYDQNSTCWIRVVQSWAGAQFGTAWIPRHGMEVMVNFLEGDPDMPIVTGCIYNGVNKLPDELPTKKTRSVMKTNSSKGGGGFNLIRLDDMKGKEQVFIHSQKRMDVRTKGTIFETHGGSRNITIGGASASGKGGDLYVTVGKDVNDHYNGTLYTLVNEKEMEQINGAAVHVYGDSLATMVKTKCELNALEIVYEAKTKISFKVGANFIQIDPSGVTIQGTITKINCMGFGQETGDPTVDDPLDAAVADTGEPGWLDRPSGPPRKRGSHKVLSQHAVAINRAGDTAQMQRIRAILAQSPTGRRQLEIYDRYGMKTGNQNGTAGEWHSADNTVILGPATTSDDDAALTFVHEINHAQADKEGTSADVNKENRADYINHNLAEDAHGERLAQQTAQELTDAGHPVTYNSSTAPSYQRGVNAAKAADPNATPQQQADAGEKAMLDDYKNGTITTGNTSPPQSYVDYWGSYYDSVHPPPGP
jgi:type VI secretion system secreted protein VgrG